jgi:hypothetical protein
VHHHAGRGLDLPNVSKSHLVGEAGQVDAVGNQPGEGGLRGAWQQEKEAGRDRKDTDGGQRGQHCQPRMETPRPAASRGLGTRERTADFGAGQGAYGEQQIQRQEKDEIQFGGQNGSRQQFQKSDGRREEIVAVRPGGEDFHDRQKEDQVNGGA